MLISGRFDSSQEKKQPVMSHSRTVKYPPGFASLYWGVQNKDFIKEISIEEDIESEKEIYLYKAM